MTTLVIIIERGAFFFEGAHGELLQALLSLFSHFKTIIRSSKQIRNKKWCDGTYHSVVLIKDTSSHILDAQ